MKLATCNEPWKDVPIEDVFRRAARIGFTGVEIAPFTLADDVRHIPPQRRREIVRAAADARVEIVGLHWLFVAPKGLHLTAPDAGIRQASADYLKALVDCCGDLGGKVVIFGSPKQRSLEPLTSFEEGWKRAKEVFAASGPSCAARGVMLCIEALGPKETNFINTIDEAARMADEIGHPNIDIMLDMKAMSTMPGGIVETVRRFGRRARHFHANLPSGKGVGMSSSPEDAAVDLKATLTTLQQSGFDGWVSCEPFDYSPDADTVAQVAIKMLKAALPGHPH